MHINIRMLLDMYRPRVRSNTYHRAVGTGGLGGLEPPPPIIFQTLLFKINSIPLKY